MVTQSTGEGIGVRVRVVGEAEVGVGAGVESRQMGTNMGRCRSGGIGA